MQRRRVRERAVGAIAGVALLSAGAACTLLTNLDGLTGGPADGGSPDGSTLEDASADANGIVTPDGGTGSGDGGAADGDAGSEASVPPFCASQSPAPTFCDDFDEDPADAAALLAPWDQITGTGGAVTRAGKIFTSSPFAMLATATAPVSINGIDICAYKSFTTASKTGEFTLAFDLYVAEADTSKNSDAVLAAFETIGTLGERWALQLEVVYDADAGAGGALDVLFSENFSPTTDAGGYISHPVSQTLPVGAWTRVTMEATIASLGSSSTIALHFGTSEVAKDGVVIPFSGYPEILVGLTYAAQSSQGWAVRYDDVTFDVVP